MTNTITMDTDACIEQAKRIIDAGGEYVRLTTQGVREAENLKNINIGLRSQGYDCTNQQRKQFNPFFPHLLFSFYNTQSDIL